MSTYHRGHSPCGQEMWRAGGLQKPPEVRLSGPASTGTHGPSAGMVTPRGGVWRRQHPGVYSAGAGAALPHPHTGQRSRGPGRGFCLQPPSYLLSHEEPTLDETVQHLLTVAVGRLAGLRGDRHQCDLRQARPDLPPQGWGRRAGAGLSGLRRRPDLQQQQVLWQQV